MATFQPVPQLMDSHDAAVDLRGKENYFATYTTQGQWALAGAAPTRPTGIIVEGAAAANGVSTCLGGKYTVWAGGPITPGDWVTSDAAGRAVLATTGQMAWGWAQNAGVLGKSVTVFYCPRQLP